MQVLNVVFGGMVGQAYCGVVSVEYWICFEVGLWLAVSIGEFHLVVNYHVD